MVQQYGNGMGMNPSYNNGMNPSYNNGMNPSYNNFNQPFPNSFNMQSPGMNYPQNQNFNNFGNNAFYGPHMQNYYMDPLNMHRGFNQMHSDENDSKY